MRLQIDQDKLKQLEAFGRDFKAVIKDWMFEPGDLVLVCNTSIESLLNKTMKPRYTGPIVVVARNKGSFYIVVEMSGAVWQSKIAKFRVVSYFVRKKIDLLEHIMAIIDMDKEGLDRIDALLDNEAILDRDYLMDKVKMVDSDDSDGSDEADEADDIYA